MKRDESRTISSCGYVYFLILVVGVLFILAAGADVSVMGETPAKTPDIGDSVAAETAQAVGDEPPAENSGDKEASNVGEEPQPADQAEEDSEEAADQAWEEILRLSVPPDYPEDWNDNPPTYKELEEYNRRQAELAALAARKAREFYNKYPKDNHANNARRREFELLTIAEQLGNTNVLERLLQMENKRLESGQLSEDARFELLARRVQRKAMKKVKDGMSSVAAELEKGVRSLQSDFGNRPEIYEFLMIVADNSAPDKARRLANEILSGETYPGVKSEARALQLRLDLIDKPLNIEFTSLDGDKISVAELKGQVVLVYFWATWYGPCLEDIQKLNEIYNEYHKKGFEIIGINIDEDKNALNAFLKQQKVEWPQFFDGKGWESKFVQKYRLSNIPEMWLLDKKGCLRYLNAGEDLISKIEELLSEEFEKPVEESDTQAEDTQAKDDQAKDDQAVDSTNTDSTNTNHPEKVEQ